MIRKNMGHENIFGYTNEKKNKLINIIDKTWGLTQPKRITSDTSGSQMAKISSNSFWALGVSNELRSG